MQNDLPFTDDKKAFDRILVEYFKSLGIHGKDLKEQISANRWKPQ